MRKYKKFNNRNRIRRGYILFAICIVAIIGMSVGYSYYFDSLTIRGSANANYKIYNIEYILNGGTNPENVVTGFKSIDEIPLPIPTKSQYIFDGWYDNDEFAGTKYTSTDQLEYEDVTLYAKWKVNVVVDENYRYDGEYVFTGSNYINTNICLYSDENINRNFLISFDIIEVDPDNVNHNTLLNSMNESGSPWYGNNVKVSGSGSSKSVKFESNSNTSSTGDVFIPSSVKNVRVIRIDHKLYYSFDRGPCIKINDYTGFTGTFDIPVMFGASLDGKLKPFRYFTGTLANMSVSFLSDNAIIGDFDEYQKTEKIVYANSGPVTMDGETDYIDTGLQLFNMENFYKDFEISFTIDSVEDGNVNQATIINMKNERITTYPGFVYRLYQQKDNTIRFEAKVGTGSGATNKIPDVSTVKISRIDSKMYLSINGGPDNQVYDYTNFNSFFDVPLTIGVKVVE